MAQQAGINPFLGTIGNLTFLKTSDGFRVRMKGGVSRDRIMKDPAYVRTRENISDFATCGRGVRLMRKAFHSEVRKVSDKRMNARLLREMRTAINTDTTHVPGQRSLANAQLNALKDFEFNSGSTLGSVFPEDLQILIDRDESKVTITLAPFVPDDVIRFPQGATHFSIVTAAGTLNFATGETATSRVSTDPKPIDHDLLTLPPFECTIPADTGLPILVVVGILFYKDAAEAIFPLRDRSFNAMSIVAVDEVA
jgi:hypothetical protein